MAITGEDAGATVGAEPRRRTGLRDAAAAGVQRLDLRNTWQVAGGAFLAVLGLVIILLAWYGAAHTPYVQQQIPYLVSGSFVGLGLMVLGGLMYWAHWLYRIYDQADLHHVADAARQEELFGSLLAAIESLSLDTRPRPRAASGRPIEAESDSSPLVATATGSNVHLQDCPIVIRHPDGVRRLSQAEAAGLSRCRICQPPLR